MFRVLFVFLYFWIQDLGLPKSWISKFLNSGFWRLFKQKTNKQTNKPKKKSKKKKKSRYAVSRYAITLLACVASVSVGFPRKFRCFGGAKIGARAKKERGGRGEENFFLSLPPTTIIFALALFSRGRKKEFAPRPLETLAMQAITPLPRYPLRCYAFY